jgi:predicted nucleic acid-binding protein
VILDGPNNTGINDLVKTAARNDKQLIAYVSLVGAEEVAEKGMLHAQRQHFPLNHRALNVVVFQHHVFSILARNSKFVGYR